MEKIDNIRDKIRRIKLSRISILNPSYPYIINILLNIKKINIFTKSRYEFYKYQKEYVLYIDNYNKTIFINDKIWDYNKKSYFETRRDFFYIFENYLNTDNRFINYSCTHNKIDKKYILSLLIEDKIDKINRFYFEHISVNYLFKSIKKDLTKN